MCSAFDEALQNPLYDPLLLIPMFILDFLYIEPFDEGTGQMSRLLTALLLYRAGYFVGKYISIEQKIENSLETYKKVLKECCSGWYQAANDYTPFVQYILEIILDAYRDFAEKIQPRHIERVSKSERIRTIIRETSGQITKSEIMAKCPDISQITVQRALNAMLKKEEIIKISGGRYTSYTWNREKES